MTTSTHIISDTLVVPGYQGSGEAHWQTWLEQQLPNAKRVHGIDWACPKIDVWSRCIANTLNSSPKPMWIVAHSFGCLASIWASQFASSKIAGALFVAPADPWRFTHQGLVQASDSLSGVKSIAIELPKSHLPFPSVVIASANDPWLKLSQAGYWAQLWGSFFINAGYVGHINADSGFGPWPDGLFLLQKLQNLYDELPRGSLLNTEPSNDFENLSLTLLREIKRDFATVSPRRHHLAVVGNQSVATQTSFD